MRRLTNPVESLDNVERAPNYREHGTRIGNLVAPNASWRSLGSVRKAVSR